MHLVIDVGNTHSVYGVWSGEKWLAVWRRNTDANDTEDELAAWLKSLFDLAGLEFKIQSAICASVVPTINDSLNRLCKNWLNVKLAFLGSGEDLGIKVCYNPPEAVGADRIANALGALAKHKPPIIVVDFGTATTFDVISESGSYEGGVIMPGLLVSSEALIGRTAKLPQFEFKAPQQAIGRDTVSSLQSGLMYGYAGAIDSLAKKIAAELKGEPTIIATGGLAEIFVDLCETIDHDEPTLTLDGLVIAMDRICS